MEKIFYINDIILKSANAVLQIQKNDGSFPPGHNGPWNNEDTPVRVTSHWAILLLKAYSLSNDNKFLHSSRMAYSFLTSKIARPHENSFYCIKSENKVIQSNGLIGQAWVLESLIEAYNHFNDSFYLSLAEDLILKHTFDEDLCLWHVLGLNGEILKIHRTFNHQLWFSVMAFIVGNICNNNKILINTKKFFEQLLSFIKFKSFIRMHIREDILSKKTSKKDKYSLKVKNIAAKSYFAKLSRGYLSFSLLALSILYSIDRTLDLWKDVKLRKIIAQSISYLDNKIFHDDGNKFGFQYNPIGFEVACLKEKFSDYFGDYKGKSIENWIIKQLSNHYDFNKMMLVKNTNDQNTFSSRIYELAKLENRLLKI